MNFNKAFRCAMVCFLILGMILGFGQQIYAADVYTTANTFEDKEKVIFIGDSITAQGNYIQFVYDYYLTRFPNKRVELINMGISGDMASGAIGRLKWDVLPSGAKKAMVMFGMNDIGRSLYGSDKSSDTIKKQKDRLEVYTTNMMDLIRQLQKNKIDVTIICSSPYDDTAKLTTANNVGCNEALGKITEINKKLAKDLKCGIIDFYTPMNTINAKVQKADPTSTIIGNDRIHPGAIGGMIMSYTFLKAQNAPALVAKCTIDTKENSILEQSNCSVTNMVYSNDKLTFDYSPGAYPLYVDNTYEVANKLVPLTKDLNQEVLTIKGLAAGKYSLEIEGTIVGYLTNDNLEKGLNLAVQKSTPQQKVAGQIAKVNQERHKAAVQIRQIRFMEQTASLKGIDPTNSAQMEKFLDSWLAEQKNSEYYSYYETQVKNYREMKPKEEEIVKKTEQLLDKVYELNKPKTYKVIIKNTDIKDSTLELNDIKDHWAKNEIIEMVKNGVVNGYTDGTFQPEKEVAVNEFIKIMVQALGYDVNAGKEDWAAPYINKAKDIGLIKKEFDTYERSIQRKEVALMVGLYLNNENIKNQQEIQSSIKDYNIVEDEYKEGILSVYVHGIMKGYSDGEFKGSNQLNRAEAVVVISRLLKEKK